MKIAFILYDYYPFGGLQDDCLKTALEVANLGHETHIFTRTWKGDQPENLNVHLMGKHGWTNTSRNERFFDQLQSELPKHQFDGIVAFNRVPNTDIYFAADPCYAARTENWPLFKKLHPRHRYYRQLERRIFGGSKAPVTLVLTKNEIGAFQKYYDLEHSRFHLLPPGVSKVEYQPSAVSGNRSQVRSEIGCKEHAVVALFVGSGFRIKGLDRALKGIAANSEHLDDLEFWVVGNGKPERYKGLIDQTNATVRFLGGRADVDRLYQAADFLLHPAYSESAGKVLLEAMTHGLPVLTTDTCGYGFHIEKAQAGIELKSPFTQEALNSALGTFIEDANQRHAWSEAALRYARENDLYSCHTAAAQTIQQTLANKHRPA